MIELGDLPVVELPTLRSCGRGSRSTMRPLRACGPAQLCERPSSSRSRVPAAPDLGPDDGIAKGLRTDVDPAARRPAWHARMVVYGSEGEPTEQ